MAVWGRRLQGAKCWMLVLAALLPAAASGRGWAFEEAQWDRFALGLVSGIAAHEMGHVAVATSKGYRVSHEGFSITYPGAQFTPAAQLQLASAGFQTQWVLSELALRDGWDDKPTTGDFAAGVVCSYVAVSAAYLTFLKNQNNGDVRGMSRATGMSRDRIALMLAVPAVLDAWRLLGDDVPRWAPALSVVSKGVGFGWIWTY